MDLWKTIRNLFVKKGTPPAATERVEAFLAFEEGKKHFGHDDQEALDSFDRAIGLGYEDTDIYGMRGYCLQGLGFHLDAVDDFDKAISLTPENANDYFARSISKSATGDYAGCVSDLQEAVRLSKRDNEYNRFWNNYAKETGWPSATAYYESRLVFAQDCLRIHAKYGELGRELRERESPPWRRANI